MPEATIGDKHLSLDSQLALSLPLSPLLSLRETLLEMDYSLSPFLLV